MRMKKEEDTAPVVTGGGLYGNERIRMRRYKEIEDNIHKKINCTQ